MDDVSLLPIRAEDLDEMCRFATDPNAGGEFEWTGFRDHRAVRRRWEEDGWINAKDASLAVVRSIHTDDNPIANTFAGIVTWRDRSVGPIKGTCYEVGIGLLPDHRDQGVGTAAHRLLVEYLFSNTPVHRLQAFTDTDNLAERRALEKTGFECEGILRELCFRNGRWRDSAIYSLLRPSAG
jgi:ribosomal-protein-alanine N-acetyltransferase